jgi:hypothetical protein
MVWSHSAACILLRLFKVAVPPLPAMIVDTLFLMLTMLSAGVANACGGVTCGENFSTEDLYHGLCASVVSGVVFVWFTVVAHTMLLVLNTLAVAHPGEQNPPQNTPAQAPQGQSNIDIVVTRGTPGLSRLWPFRRR